MKEINYTVTHINLHINYVKKYTIQIRRMSRPIIIIISNKVGEKRYPHFSSPVTLLRRWKTDDTQVAYTRVNKSGGSVNKSDVNIRKVSK